MATLRAFNRCYTQRIGVLAESYLGAGRALGSSRLLFEIGADGVPVVDLRRRLGLDSGYLSRLLRELEQEHLITLAADPRDGRQRIARLSPAGRREWRRLDRRSADVARHLVEPLSVRHRAELASALASAERLLRAATIDIDLADPRSPEAQSALARYFGELDERFRSGFDPGVVDAVDVAPMRSPLGAFVLMRSDLVTVGCGGVQRIDDATSEIKRMWIDPDWRGLGLGGRLLTAVGSRRSRSWPYQGRARHQRNAGRGDRDVRTSRLHADRAVQRQPVRASLVHQAPVTSPSGNFSPDRRIGSTGGHEPVWEETGSS